MEKNIYIIHENDEWLIPLRESFRKINAPFKEWHMDKASFDFKKFLQEIDSKTVLVFQGAGNISSLSKKIKEEYL